MTLLSRLQEILRAQQHAALDTLENPRIMSAQLLRDVDADLAEVRTAMLNTAVRIKQIEREIQQLGQELDHAQECATAALRLGQEDAAREHLNRKLEQQQAQQDLEQHLQTLTGNMDAWRSERRSLKQERSQLTQQMRLICPQTRSAQAPGVHAERLYQQRMSRRERMAAYTEASSAGQDLLSCAQDLRAEEDAINPRTCAAVESELAALKARMQPQEARP